MLIGPQQSPIQIIDHAVAIRPQDRHIPRSRHQFGLQLGLSSFCPATGKTNGPPSPHSRKLRHHIDGGKTVHTDKGGIRNARQISQRGIGL